MLSSPACRALSEAVADGARTRDSGAVTPLQRFLAGVRDEIGGNEMSHRARALGHRVSAQRISQIINDPRPKRLPASMVEALAAACGVRPMAIATLEDEGFFLVGNDPLPTKRAAVNE